MLPTSLIWRTGSIVAFLFGLVAGIFPIFESDLFWHLASGRWMLEHGRIPRVDPFRFTAEGVAWVDHEWLFQIVVRGVEVIGGLDALVALRAVALGGFAVLMFLSARRAGLGDGPSGLVCLGAVLGVRPRFLIRPEIVTLFAMVLLLHGLERLCARFEESGAGAGLGSARVPLAGLAGLTVLWVNFHGAALLAPGLAFLFLFARALSRRSEGSGRLGAGIVLGVPALLGACLLVNPYGWRLLEVPLGIARALRDLPASNPEWLSAFAAPQPYLFGGLAVVGALAGLARSRSGRWPAPEWALPALAMAVLALSGVRHQALFFAVAAPFAARCLARLEEARELSPRAERRGRIAFGAGAAVLAIWCAFPPASGPLAPRHGGLTWGRGLALGRFPVRAAELLAAQPGIGRLYNELVHGGYLLWRLFPERRVFIDGRMELEPALLHEVARARRSAEGWEALLEGEGAVGALVFYDERRVPVYEPDAGGALRPVDSRSIHALLFPRERWHLVEWDDASMLFLDREAAARWPGEPYRFVQPEDLPWMLAEAAADPAFRAGALAELERKLAEEPDCRRARRLQARLRGGG